MLKRIVSTVTYRVPTWDYCNHQAPHSLTKLGFGACRFCIKSNKKHICVLYNEPLDVIEGIQYKKVPKCIKATKRSISEIEETVPVLPTTIIRTTIIEYRKLYKQLCNEGYTDALAAQLTKEIMLKNVSDVTSERGDT